MCVHIFKIFVGLTIISRENQGWRGDSPQACMIARSASAHLIPPENSADVVTEGITTTDPRADFKEKVAQHHAHLERRHSRANQTLWSKFFSRTRSDGGRLSQEEEFVQADYEPRVIIYFCVTISIGYGVYGFTTMRNKQGLSSHLHSLHFIAFYVESAIAAASALLFMCSGWHTSVLRRHYQVIASSLLFALYSLNLVQRTANDQRLALSPVMWSPYVNKSITLDFAPKINCTDRDPWGSAWIEQTQFSSEDSGCETRFVGAASTGVQTCYFMVMAPARLTARTATILMSLYIVALSFAVVMGGTARATGPGGGASRSVSHMFFLLLPSQPPSLDLCCFLSVCLSACACMCLPLL